MVFNERPQTAPYERNDERPSDATAEIVNSVGRGLDNSLQRPPSALSRPKSAASPTRRIYRAESAPGLAAPGEVSAKMRAREQLVATTMKEAEEFRQVKAAR